MRRDFAAANGKRSIEETDLDEHLGCPNPRQLRSGGQLSDLSQPRKRRVPGEAGLSAALFHAVGSRSGRPVITTGKVRATRAPTLTEC